MGLPTVQRESGQSIKATEQLATEQTKDFEATTKVLLPPGITWSNATGVVSFPLPTEQKVKYSNGTNVNAGSSEDIEVWHKQKIPLYVALIGTAIGLGLLLFVLKLFINSSRAAKSIVSVADNWCGAMVDSLKPTSAMGPNERERVSDMLAAVEKLRGKVNRKI